jgi:hypothetical protein
VYPAFKPLLSLLSGLAILPLLSRSDVTNTSPFATARLTVPARLVLAAGGATLIAMLAVALWLRPSPLGRGTHEQLGLPPCTFVVVLGRPCPSCGMTTAWARVVRGQLVPALQANVGGTILALAAVVAAPWMLISAVHGRWLHGRPSETVLIVGGLGLIVVTLIDWAVRLLI